MGPGKRIESNKVQSDLNTVDKSIISNFYIGKVMLGITS